MNFRRLRYAELSRGSRINWETSSPPATGSCNPSSPSNATVEHSRRCSPGHFCWLRRWWPWSPEVDGNAEEGIYQMPDRDMFRGHVHRMCKIWRYARRGHDGGIVTGGFLCYGR